jgi:hypothetical protein
LYPPEAGPEPPAGPRAEDVVVMAGSPLAPGGPTPYAKTLDSLDAQHPFLLDLEFQWV